MLQGAQIEANGVLQNTNQNGRVDFGPFSPNATVEIHCKYFGYYDTKTVIYLPSLENFDGFSELNITMKAKISETLLQLDLQYDPEKFSLMELNVIEVNNASQATCHSTVR